MTSEMIPGLVCYLLFCFIGCAIMASIDSVFTKISFKTCFIVLISSTLVGAILGAFLLKLLIPSDPDSYKLGLLVLGPGLGFSLGGLGLSLWKPLFNRHQ